MRESGQRALLVIAHRGSSGSAPENTMAAFRMAVAADTDMIELDVRLTLDGDLAVMHDRTINRTTNGRGRIRTIPTATLHLYDAGSWFGAAFRGERVPLLKDVLTTLPHQVGINIEVKTDGEPRKAIFAGELITILARYGKGRRIIVSSFDHRFLARLRKSSPGIVTGALQRAVVDGSRKPSAIAQRLGATAFICSLAQLRQRGVRDAHDRGIFVAVYGVNTQAQLNRARRFGVDAVVTDFPEVMVRALRNG